MKYVIMPIADISTRHLAKAGAKVISDLRISLDGKLAILKVDEEHLSYFAAHRLLTRDDALSLMQNSDWNKDTFFNKTLDFLGL
jgi:hypothetical protein